MSDITAIIVENITVMTSPPENGSPVFALVSLSTINFFAYKMATTKVKFIKNIIEPILPPSLIAFSLSTSSTLYNN